MGSPVLLGVGSVPVRRPGGPYPVEALLPVTAWFVAEFTVTDDHEQPCRAGGGQAEGAGEGVDRGGDVFPVVVGLELGDGGGGDAGVGERPYVLAEITVAVWAGTVVWRAALARIHAAEATWSWAHRMEPDTSQAMPSRSGGVGATVRVVRVQGHALARV